MVKGQPLWSSTKALSTLNNCTINTLVTCSTLVSYSYQTGLGIAQGKMVSLGGKYHGGSSDEELPRLCVATPFA